MSLLRGGQGVSGWNKRRTCAGRSEAPVRTKAAQPEPYTGSEKPDSFFSQPRAQGIPQTITLKLG